MYVSSMSSCLLWNHFLSNILSCSTHPLWGRALWLRLQFQHTSSWLGSWADSRETSFSNSVTASSTFAFTSHEITWVRSVTAKVAVNRRCQATRVNMKHFGSDPSVSQLVISGYFSNFTEQSKPAVTFIRIQKKLLPPSVTMCIAY